MRSSAAARALRSLAMSAARVMMMPSAAPARSHHRCYAAVRAATIRSRLPPPLSSSSSSSRRRPSFSTSTASSAAAAAAAASPSSTAEDLASWLEARGGSAPRDRVAVFAEGASKGLALRCVSGARAGDVLVRLPASCLLDGGDDGVSPSSPSSPPSSPPSPSPLLPPEVEAAVSRLCSRVPAELWGARLALRLLAHRAAGDASPLAPYVRALPAGVGGVPIFYGREAIEILQEYAPVGSQVLKRCRFLAAFVRQEGLDGGSGAGESGGGGGGSSAAADASVAFSGARVGADALGWAFSIATSRAFRVRGEGALPSLLPLIDMANHDFAPTAKVVPWRGGGEGSGGGGSDSGGVALVATADLEPGTPLTLNYGALPSDFFLLDYGFFAPYPGNPFDVVKLRWSQALVDASADFARIKMPSSDDGSLASSSPPWKGAALAQLQLQAGTDDPEVRVLAGAPWVDGRFLAAARIAAAASPADLRGRSLPSPSSSSASSSPPPSSSRSDPSLADLDRGFLSDPAAEARALRLLGGACLLSLAAFPTTPEQDRAVLALGPGEEGALTTADEVAARRFVLSKKEILERAAKEMGARARAAAARAKNKNGGGGGGGGEKSKGFGKK